MGVPVLGVSPEAQERAAQELGELVHYRNPRLDAERFVALQEERGFVQAWEALAEAGEALIGTAGDVEELETGPNARFRERLQGR